MPTEIRRMRSCHRDQRRSRANRQAADRAQRHRRRHRGHHRPPHGHGAARRGITSQVFDIALEQSAVTAAIDGRFRSGPLQGHGEREVVPEARKSARYQRVHSTGLQLVLTGPRSAVGRRGNLLYGQQPAASSVMRPYRNRYTVANSRTVTDRRIGAGRGAVSFFLSSDAP
jgi:hypothetical protein